MRAPAGPAFARAPPEPMNFDRSSAMSSPRPVGEYIAGDPRKIRILLRINKAIHRSVMTYQTCTNCTPNSDHLEVARFQTSLQLWCWDIVRFQVFGFWLFLARRFIPGVEHFRNSILFGPHRCSVAVDTYTSQMPRLRRP